MRNLSILITIILFMLSCTVAGVVVYVPEAQLKAGFSGVFTTFDLVARLILLGLAALVGGAGLIALAWLSSVARSSRLLLRSHADYRQAQALKEQAEAMKAQRDASLLVNIAPAGSQLVVSEVAGGLSFIHKPIHLSPVSVNGVAVEPAPWQIENWRLHQLSHATAKQAALPAASDPRQLTAGESSLELPEEVYLLDHIGQPSLHSIFLGIGRLKGETAAPYAIRQPLERLVHIATAGSSGFGKSTFMQSLAYQVLNAPNSRPVLMDAQAVTFSIFEGHPALLYRIATTEEDIFIGLDFLLDEMRRRQGLFSKIRGCVKLQDYNAKADNPLPVIPVFIDELGLVANNKEIEAKVIKLSQGGRKFGIDLILGSQTWLAKQFSTALRDNLSTSIQFHARDKAQSRILLSAPDAADITQPGRAFAVLPGQAGLFELQAPLVSEQDLRSDVPAVKQPEPAAARARAMGNAGASLTEIAREVLRGGKGKPNNRDIQQVKAWLNEDDKGTTKLRQGDDNALAAVG